MHCSNCCVKNSWLLQQDSRNNFFFCSEHQQPNFKKNLIEPANAAKCDFCPQQLSLTANIIGYFSLAFHTILWRFALECMTLLLLVPSSF